MLRPLIASALFLLICGIAFDRAMNPVGLAWADQPSGDRDAQAANRVDQLLQKSWQAFEVHPAPSSDDAEFCRRVWLDLAGVAPPVWQLQSFLADDSVNKREQLIDSLIGSTRFATHMAERWNEFLLPVEMLDDQQANAAALRMWLRKQFLNNTPYDHVVGAFLTAGGKSDQGPAIFYTSRNLEPVKLAGATSRLFLGVQLECAQCHDHPFARWTQDDFWSFAAFFSQLQLNDSRIRVGQAIEDRPGLELNFPETDRVMSPRYPGVIEPPEPDPTDFRRRQLTIWLASRNNPYFARAAANRVWKHLFGHSLVESVDVVESEDETGHAELLQFLADHLVDQRFDLQSLYAMLARTDAYGRTSAIDIGPRPPIESFAAMTVKTLSAAQYYDSLQQNVLLGSTDASPESIQATAAIREEFLRRMRVQDALPTDYPHGVVQALGMMNGPEMLLATDQRQSGLVASLEAPFLSDEDRVQAVFMACLSRPTSITEQATFLEYIQQPADESTRPARISDMVWILLNTAECFVCP